MTGAHSGPRAWATASRRWWPVRSPLLLLATTLVISACASSRQGPLSGPGATERGTASWYGPKFHGKRTANGEVYDMHRMTAAHRRLPFGTVVLVTNLDNDRRVEVRINDRGPFVKRRILDLSRAAADAIGMLGPGTARIELRVLRGPPAPRYTVQVAAFTSAERAEALAEELRERYPETAIAHDGVWHRVQVGSFGRRGDAESVRREIAARGLMALVVSLVAP